MFTQWWVLMQLYKAMLLAKEGVAVYGRVFGDVISEGPVRIAKGGEVHGNVQANDAQIGGSVDGNIRVENRVVLGAECSLKGDLAYRSLVIEEGAEFQGHCILVENEESSSSKGSKKK